MTTSVRRRAVLTVRRAAVCALAFGFASLATAAPVSAASMNVSGSITGGSPTYERVSVGLCSLSGVTAHYAAIQFTTVGQSATTININVTASGFTPVVTLYQGAFDAGNANVNCYTEASNGSLSVGFGGLSDPFTTQFWTLVVAADGSATGTFTASIESTNTGVLPGWVSVHDTSAPTLTVPANITTEATGPNGALVNYVASAMDDQDPSPSVSCSPPAGNTFAIGTTPVNCTATDWLGNSSTGSFTVTVVDTTSPTLTIPADATIEATSAAGAPFTFSATATDVVDASPTVVCSASSGDTFPLGTTTVNCTATDDALNSSTGSFSVTVQDTTAPSLSLPPDATIEATSAAGATHMFTALATDLADASPTVSCIPASGDTFPLGATTVNCTAADDSLNIGTGSFTVTVVDSTPPALTLPGDTFATATGPSGAAVTYAATATDAVDPTPTVTCTPPSGDTFPLGPTTVNCTATDDDANTSTGSFTVTVLDEGDPVLALPANIIEEAAGPSGAVVDFTATATDDVDPAPDVVCTPASGETFAIGDTTVSCTATDNDGNSTTGSFTVSVVDTSAPVLDLPADITVTAGDENGAIVTWEMSAHDAVVGDVPVTCTPPSGSLFPVGVTTVTCEATDAVAEMASGFRAVEQVSDGNVATGTFTVTVAAAPPPSTTTVPTTSTTVPPTTTAPTTTAPATTAPGTTAPGTTTTIPVPLPSTGSQTGSMTVVATVIVLAGSALVGIATLRRRRPA